MGERIHPMSIASFSMLPNWLARRNTREISHGAKITYARLVQYAGNRPYAYPKIATLAGEVGVRERQMKNYLGELEMVRLVEVEQIGFGKPNRYYFLDHPWRHDQPTVPEVQDRAPLEVQDRAPTEVQDRALPIGRDPEEENTRKTSGAAAPHRVEIQPVKRKKTRTQFRREPERLAEDSLAGPPVDSHERRSEWSKTVEANIRHAQMNPPTWPLVDAAKSRASEASQLENYFTLKCRHHWGVNPGGVEKDKGERRRYFDKVLVEGNTTDNVVKSIDSFFHQEDPDQKASPWTRYKSRSRVYLEKARKSRQVHQDSHELEETMITLTEDDLEDWEREV